MALKGVIFMHILVNQKYTNSNFKFQQVKKRGRPDAVEKKQDEVVTTGITVHK